MYIFSQKGTPKALSTVNLYSLVYERNACTFGLFKSEFDLRRDVRNQSTKYIGELEYNNMQGKVLNFAHLLSVFKN